MNRGLIYRFGTKIKNYGERARKGSIVRFGLWIKEIAENLP